MKIPVKAEVVSQLSVTDIFKKYQAQLRGYILKRIPSKEDAEDILQNVFYQLTKMYENQNPIEQVSGWLYSVARNQIIDSSRKQKEESLPYYSSEDDEFSFMDIYDEDNSPEDDLLKTLVWEEIETALNELPEEQKVIFELTELQGFSFKEISESTGLSVNTLISRKRYAVLHLRNRLSQLYEDIRIK